MRATMMIALVLGLWAPPAAFAEDEAAAIEATIESAYIDGVWNGDEALARQGFDPAFVMQVAQEERALAVTLDGWLERLGLDGEPLEDGITHRVELLDQSGQAAVARVEIFRDGEPLYTDYMSLYHFPDGWMIVGKIFHSHQ